MNVSLPELKLHPNDAVVWLASRTVVGVRVNIPSNAASPGAGASLRLDVPVTANVWLAVTISVKSTSPTVSVPLVDNVVFVSNNNAVSGPSVIIGASFVPLMVMVRFSVL